MRLQQQTVTEAQAPVEKSKGQPYERPKMRRLGSLSQITLGSGGAFPDGSPGKPTMG